MFFFFFQAEDGIRDIGVTGVQTCALPIYDVVLPDPAAGVADGDTVVLNRARPLTLTVDGVESEVFVTALSVDEALAQLGYRAEDLVVSASRNEIGRAHV